jgi:signal transduction histidine kinase
MDADAWSTSNKLRVNVNGTLTNNSVSLNGYANAANAPVSQYDVQQQQEVQRRRGQQEFQARQQVQIDNNDLLVGNNSGNYFSSGVGMGVMRPLWTGDALLLARRVSVNGQKYVQGCVLDWPAIRTWLLESLTDLPLKADLVPAKSAADDKEPRMLASLPVQLVIAPESIPPDAGPSFVTSLARLSPTHVTLTVAWLGVLLAAAAVAVLLRGVMSLSERRGAFVSAVTHELRTPLTTLRMYTEMLADGMVADPQKQASYHRTLRAEANRLGHLVDNVLLYSRLERSNRDAKIESAPLGEVLDRITPRLADRATQAGMRLDLRIPESARAAKVRANLLSVEQILFNLVDNACKYAASADSTVDLTATPSDDHVEVAVHDHGPGLDASARARLFQPFSKSVTEAANTAPGLGLGLALSHRLAKNMNASLRLDDSKPGAVFILRLPRDNAGG